MNGKEWWSEYFPTKKELDNGMMYCVALDSDALQNKMKLANIKICEKCNKDNGKKLFIKKCELMNCPVEGSIYIVDEIKLSKDCKYKLEHIVAFQ